MYAFENAAATAFTFRVHLQLIAVEPEVVNYH